MFGCQGGRMLPRQALPRRLSTYLVVRRGREVHLCLFVEREDQVQRVYNTDSGKLDRLLDQLYAKKSWLDAVIDGLEAAVRSPDHRLIESVLRTFGDSRKAKPKVDVQAQQKARLARLAVQVRGGGSSRTRHRAASNGQATR